MKTNLRAKETVIQIRYDFLSRNKVIKKLLQNNTPKRDLRLQRSGNSILLKSFPNLETEGKFGMCV